MSVPMKRLLAVACVAACFCAIVRSAETVPGEVVRLGWESRAVSWLPQSGDIPHTVVRYEDVAPLTGLPAKTDYYEIDPQVAAAAYSYFFYVRGAGHTFVVASFLNLQKLCHELGVLANIQQRDKGKEVAVGLGQGLKSIGTGLGNLVMHPGLSMKNAGENLREKGRSLERAVGNEEKVGRDAEGTNRSHLGAGPAGGERRALAYELGVDVYTSNPVLRDALVELSRYRVAGSVATWAIPYHLGTLSLMNPFGGDAEIELMIRNLDPDELRRQVGKNLEPVFGMSREDGNMPLRRLLMNPNYTPRGIAYIGLDLSLMRAAANLPMVLETLASADSPD